MANTVEVVGGLGAATDSDVLEGVTYTSDNGIKRSGTFSPTAENISYDGTTSGLTSTTVQKAIDEVVNNKVNTSQLSNYYTKSETDDIELITVDDIDTICGVTA